MFEDVPKQASWIVQKILKTTKYFNEAGYILNEVQSMEKFSTKQFYLKLRGTFQKVAWRKLVCHNQGLLKWIFILRLTALRRLYTRDRLFKWGVTQDQFCPLCEQDHESLAHLFFTCETIAQLWKKLLNWIGVTRNPMAWEDEQQWAI